MGIIQKKLENANFIPQMTASDAIEEFLKNDLNKFIDDVGLQLEIASLRKEKIINDMPDEVLFNIMSYLDLKSLYNCSLVCKQFQQIAKDPLLYLEINLKLYWHRVDSRLMESLKERCKLIRKLDLSSCGCFNSVTCEDFVEFLRANGRTLTHLRLNWSKFLNSFSLQQIGFKCENLIELQMQNYANVTREREFMSLSLLNKLETLDLSRSGIDTYATVALIKNNPNLTHLNLSYNHQLNTDQVCHQLSLNCKELRSLDLWKCHNLSVMGLRALAKCEKLEVLDLGWDLREESNITETFKTLLQNCGNVRKMVLAAVRAINDRDLENISQFCVNLEHLDLMGIVGLSSEGVLKILQNCKRLKLIDLSFCENLDDLTLFRWSSEFNVCIKRSDVPNEF